MRLGNTSVISFINLKGGVGRTTTSVNVAATLSQKFYESGSNQKEIRVLFIDLDPQSNGSLTFLDKNDYEKVEHENKTIYELFRYELSRNDDQDTFDLNPIIIKHVHNLNVDVIPSSLKLFDIQDKLVSYNRYYLSAIDILYNALNKLRMEKTVYTHIIIDCPPSLGLITQNALSMSRYYIVPVFLDSYSRWGLDKINESIERLKRTKASCVIELLGVVYSKVNTKTTIENNEYLEQFSKWDEDFRQNRKIRSSDSIVFTTKIKELDIIRKAESAHKPIIIYDKNNEIQVDGFSKLTDEVLARIQKLKNA